MLDNVTMHGGAAPSWQVLDEGPWSGRRAHLRWGIGEPMVNANSAVFPAARGGDRSTRPHQANPDG